MPGLELNQNQKLTLYFLIGLSAIGLAVSGIRHGGSGEIELSAPGEFEQAPNTRNGSAGSFAPAVTTKVVFQVAGCVNCPGVYSLEQGSRVIDAIKAAGGAKPNADTEAMNLAAKIVDGSRIYVPAKGELSSAGVAVPIATPQPTVRAGSSQARRTSSVAGTIVNINTAGLEELDLLPGVGPVTAQRIVDYRKQIGRFTSVDQLLDVKGIGPKKLEQMRPYVAL